MDPQDPHGIIPGLILGCPLWGDSWIDRFLAFCLPSMREPENRAALEGCRLVIFTDAAGMDRLRDVPGLELHEMPPFVMGWDKYRILAACHHELLAEAARTGVGITMMVPDIIYARGFFANLKRLAGQHEAIVGLNLWANAETALPELEGWRLGDGSLSISPLDLGELGWRYLHPSWRAFVLNGIDAMPAVHLIAWRGVDAIHIRCPHLNPLWLSPRLCREARPSDNLDAVLPELIPAGVTPYVPTLEDGLTLLEFVEETDKPPVGIGTFQEFARHVRCARPDLRFFDCDIRVPIYPRSDGLPAAEINAQFAAIVERLEMAG